MQPFWQGQPLNCNTVLQLAAQPWQLQQLQFFLSGFAQGSHLLKLKPAANASAEIALLGMVCDQSRPDAGSWQLEFTEALRAGPLKFALGVPFALNHQNPLRAQGPLQQMDMHWSWQGGYKFFRLDLTGATDGWSLHLGSTGCQAASVMRAPNQPCAQPNLVDITLDYQGQQTILLDLTPILSGWQPTAANSCFSDQQQQSCQQLLPLIKNGASNGLIRWAP